MTDPATKPKTLFDRTKSFIQDNLTWVAAIGIIATLSVAAVKLKNAHDDWYKDPVPDLKLSNQVVSWEPYPPSPFDQRPHPAWRVLVDLIIKKNTVPPVQNCLVRLHGSNTIFEDGTIEGLQVGTFERREQFIIVPNSEKMVEKGAGELEIDCEKGVGDPVSIDIPRSRRAYLASLYS